MEDAPQAQSELGWGAGPPFLLSLSLFLLLLLQLGRGKPSPTGSRTPPLGAPYEGRPSPPPLLYIRGEGHPIETQQLIPWIS